jgi:hypothetical protein
VHADRVIQLATLGLNSARASPLAHELAGRLAVELKQASAALVAARLRYHVTRLAELTRVTVRVAVPANEATASAITPADDFEFNLLSSSSATWQPPPPLGQYSTGSLPAPAGPSNTDGSISSRRKRSARSKPRSRAVAIPAVAYGNSRMILNGQVHRGSISRADHVVPHKGRLFAPPTRPTSRASGGSPRRSLSNSRGGGPGRAARVRQMLSQREVAWDDSVLSHSQISGVDTVESAVGGSDIFSPRGAPQQVSSADFEKLQDKVVRASV